MQIRRKKAKPVNFGGVDVMVKISICQILCTHRGYAATKVVLDKLNVHVVVRRNSCRTNELLADSCLRCMSNFRGELIILGGSFNKTHSTGVTSVENG